MRISWRAALAAGFLAGTAHTGLAQIDYRNLDDDRPVLVEDAYPAERYAFEFLAPYRLLRSRAGTSLHAFIPELEYGIVRNGEIGLKLPVAGDDATGTSAWGLSGLRAFALYNLNTESPLLPALSLRTDATFPVGSMGGDRTEVALKVMATRSFGASRLHVNASYRVSGNRSGTSPAAESVGRWWYGAAVDRTLLRRSALLVGEVYALREADGIPVEVNASLGMRYQWSPTAVLDLGVSRGLRKGLGPDLAFTIGVARAFAVAALMPHGRAPIAPSAGGSHEHQH